MDSFGIQQKIQIKNATFPVNTACFQHKKLNVHKHIQLYDIIHILSIINPGLPASNMCNLFRIILEGKYSAAAVTGVPALATIKNRLYGSCSHFTGKRAGRCWRWQHHSLHTDNLDVFLKPLLAELASSCRQLFGLYALAWTRLRYNKENKLNLLARLQKSSLTRWPIGHTCRLEREREKEEVLTLSSHNEAQKEDAIISLLIRYNHLIVIKLCAIYEGWGMGLLTCDAGFSPALRMLVCRTQMEHCGAVARMNDNLLNLLSKGGCWDKKTSLF